MPDMINSDSRSSWSSLLGKKVVLTLSVDNPAEIVRGELLSYSEDGEAVIKDSLGVVHFCWPSLHAEEDVG